MYPYPHQMFFRIEKILGFFLFVVGVFAVLKITGVLAADFLFPNDLLLWVTTGACLLFGLVLMTHQQHHMY